MTHLSVKTLRYYHRVGLLVPAEVDQGTGYRYYATEQVPTAQAIRRFRDLQMPVDEVRAVLEAPDPPSRNELIMAHLDRMEGQLAETQTAVASLRALLERPVAPLPVERRRVPSTTALAVSGTVVLGDLGAWWSEAFDELHRTAGTLGIERTGPDGALFDDALFEEELGEVVAFVPMRAQAEERTTLRLAAAGRARSILVPEAEVMVAVHTGSHADADRTYGALGTYVAEHALGGPGPIREYYTVSRHDTADVARWRTEIGWPLAGPPDNELAGQ